MNKDLIAACKVFEDSLLLLAAHKAAGDGNRKPVGIVTDLKTLSAVTPTGLSEVLNTDIARWEALLTNGKDWNIVLPCHDVAQALTYLSRWISAQYRAYPGLKAEVMA